MGDVQNCRLCCALMFVSVPAQEQIHSGLITSRGTDHSNCVLVVCRSVLYHIGKPSLFA